MRRLWWIPLVFALIVGGVGTYAYRTLAEAMRSGLREKLQTILEADVAALELWLAHQQAAARAAGLEPIVRQLTAELVALDRATPREELRAALFSSDALRRMRDAMTIAMKVRYFAFGVLREDGLVLAASEDLLVGRRIAVDFERNSRVFAGQTTISPPALDDVTGEPLPLLRVAAPIRGADGDVLAVMGFVVPASEFTRVLQVARAGESGETYAFDERGAMISQSRFEEQLVEIGLLEPGQDSVLRIEIRDPGGDLTRGFEPQGPLTGRPLTRMAAAAITSGAGFDIDGYRDYRGVPVVGAWTWLPDLGIGVTTEIDYDEAYSGLATVRLAFGGLAGLLLLAAAGMLVGALVITRLERRYERARMLGRYRIVEKIGEGGMGTVYRAQHALLRRPTAVKLLDAARASAEAVKRFEREVQAAASLTHPNTIEIYDYGRTPGGSFYYAMEYLDGISIAQLVDLDGAQPEARAQHILRQAAGSLAEAHARKLVHRDLKPSNLMLCSRGGVFDFVKVLDFGLVRPRDDDLQLTQDHSLTGTPLYLSPEALEAPDKVDAHSDVYQLGAIAYYLLTGQHVFKGENLVELMSALLHQTPTPPSQVLGRPVSSAFEALVLACLEKDPARRPTDAAVLLDALEQCHCEGTWTQRDARTWWEESAPMRAPDGAEPDTTGSLPSGWQVDLTARSGSA